MAVTAKTITASGLATADVLALTGVFSKFELIHHGDVDEVAYFRTDGTTAVAAADENKALLPTERLTIPTVGDGTVSVSIVVTTGTPKLSIEGVS